MLRSNSNYAGADWLARQLERHGRKMSPFGEAVADLLGDLYQGIYHISREVQRASVAWDAPHYISVTVRGSDFASYDNSRLTLLVLLCHDRCIRCEVDGASWRYLRLAFSRRTRDGAEGWQRHPTIEDQISRLRPIYATREAPQEAVAP